MDPLVSSQEATTLTSGQCGSQSPDPHAPGPSHERPAKTQRKNNIDEMQLLQEAYNELKSCSQNENAFSAVGSVVSNNLKEMNSENQIYAQKLINDIIFLGRLGRLTSSSSVVE